jgi:hypothetical protein
LVVGSSPTQPKRFCFGRDGVDDLPEFLEGDPLIGMRLKGLFEVWFLPKNSRSDSEV